MQRPHHRPLHSYTGPNEEFAEAGHASKKRGPKQDSGEYGAMYKHRTTGCGGSVLCSWAQCPWGLEVGREGMMEKVRRNIAGGERGISRTTQPLHYLDSMRSILHARPCPYPCVNRQSYSSRCRGAGTLAPAAPIEVCPKFSFRMRSEGASYTM